MIFFTIIWTGRAGQVGAGGRVGGLVRRVVGYGYCTVISQIASIISHSIYAFFN